MTEWNLAICSHDPLNAVKYKRFYKWEVGDFNGRTQFFNSLKFLGEILSDVLVYGVNKFLYLRMGNTQPY
jgi:hypothetical protein